MSSDEHTTDLKETKEEESPTMETTTPTKESDVTVMMKGRTGLLNIGNTCYMNTGIQVGDGAWCRFCSVCRIFPSLSCCC